MFECLLINSFSLLYGLMRSSSKVNGSSSKKNSILRFVSSCGEREIKEMVEIMTSSLSHFNGERERELITRINIWRVMLTVILIPFIFFHIILHCMINFIILSLSLSQYLKTQTPSLHYVLCLSEDNMASFKR